MADVSIKALNTKTARIRELQDSIRKLKDETTELNKELSGLKREVIDILQNNELPNYRNSDGLFSITTRVTAKIQDQEALKEWMESHDLWTGNWTVHNQTLNRLYKNQVEIEEEKGNFGFEIPGTERAEFTDLSVREK